MTDAIAPLLIGCAFFFLSTCASASAGEPNGTAAESATDDLVMGPYVNHVTVSGARILWVSRPGVAGQCAVQPAAGKAGETSRVEVNVSELPERPERLHTAVVTGLAAARDYRYTVTCGTGRIEGTFRTALPAGERKPFRFIVYGDSQGGPVRHASVVKGIERELPASFVMILGDFTDNGTDWPLWKREFFGPARDLLRRTALWTLRGNHEMDGVMYRALFDIPNNERWYSFDYGNVHFVILDSESRGADRRAMVKWLDEDLAANEAEWTIVCYHRPSFNVGGHGETWGREDVVPVMEKHEVDMVLNGHSHLYERFRPIGAPGKKPIIHLISGGGGGGTYAAYPSPILDASYSGIHYCVFNVDGARLDVVAKKPDGEVIDRFTLVKKDGRFQDEVMRAALTTDVAVPLVKVFKLQWVDLAQPPRAGVEAAARLEAEGLPKETVIRIEGATDTKWKVRPHSFRVGEGPLEVMVTPPEGVKFAVTPWHGQLDPMLLFRVSIGEGENVRSCDNVQVLLRPAVLYRLVPAPRPVGIPRLPDGAAVDGRLADWRRVPPLHLPSTGAASKSLRLAWRPDGIYGALSVRDGDIRIDSRRPWQADVLEIDLEPDRRRRLSIRDESNAAKLFLHPLPDDGPGPAGVRVQFARFRRDKVKAVWLKTDGGYEIEFAVAADAVKPVTLEAGTTMGFHFALRNGEELVEEFLDTSRFASTWSAPVFWGAVRLDAK